MFASCDGRAAGGSSAIGARTWVVGCHRSISASQPCAARRRLRERQRSRREPPRSRRARRHTVAAAQVARRAGAAVAAQLHVNNSARCDRSRSRRSSGKTPSARRVQCFVAGVSGGAPSASRHACGASVFTATAEALRYEWSQQCSVRKCGSISGHLIDTIGPPRAASQQARTAKSRCQPPLTRRRRRHAVGDTRVATSSRRSSFLP